MRRDFGIPFTRHSDTDGGLTSQSFATSTVPPSASIISESVMIDEIIGAPNGKCQGTPNEKCFRLAEMKTLAERISAALSEAGMSQSDLATACNVKPPSVNDWVSGKTKTLKAGTAMRAAEALKVNFLWLTEGTGPMRDGLPVTPRSRYIEDAEAAGFLPVRRVHIQLSAGVSGFSVEQDENDGLPIFFRADWFRQKGLRHDRLIAVRVTGESMMPSLFDGDLVVINTQDTSPKDGEVFAVNYEGELVIKRMRRESGDWWLDSDNADQVRNKPRKCGDGCFILGRVIYKQSERI